MPKSYLLRRLHISRTPGANFSRDERSRVRPDFFKASATERHVAHSRMRFFSGKVNSTLSVSLTTPGQWLGKRCFSRNFRSRTSLSRFSRYHDTISQNRFSEPETFRKPWHSSVTFSARFGLRCTLLAGRREKSEFEKSPIELRHVQSSARRSAKQTGRC